MRLEILIIIMAVVLLVFVVEVVRRRRLSESYALLWIAVGVGGILLGVAVMIVTALLVDVVAGRLSSPDGHDRPRTAPAA